MKHRRTVIVVVAVAGVATTIFLLTRSDRCSAGRFTYHERREWGYVSGPSSAVGKWIAAKVRARNYQAVTNIDQKALVLESNVLLFSSYSSPTSVWFNFGTLYKTNFWQFALPKTPDPERALVALPGLRFMGTNEEFWAAALKAKNVSVRRKDQEPLGGGGIRLPVGEIFFARHAESSDIFLVQPLSAESGLWGDIRLRYRTVAVKRPRNIRRSPCRTVAAGQKRERKR